MKKYLFLYLITIISIATIFVSGSIVNASAQADILILRPEDTENTVTASGKMQYGSESPVAAENYCLIDHFAVKNGSKVKKGDPLFYIYEPEQTAGLSYSYSDAEALLNSLSKTALTDEILNEVKKYSSLKTVCAEKGGTVSGIAYEENEIVSKNSVVLKIADTSSFVIPVNINEAYIERITIGQKARVKFTAIENKTFSGTVYKISDEAKQTSGLTGKETSVEVTIKLDETNESLRIGYTAECSVITSVDKDRLIVPYEYIRSDESGEYVFLAEKNLAVKRYIETGNEYKSGIEVTSGLSSGSRIIKNCQEVSDGQRIIVGTGENNA